MMTDLQEYISELKGVTHVTNLCYYQYEGRVSDGEQIRWISYREYLPIRDWKLVAYYTMDETEVQYRQQLHEHHQFDQM